jgi:hypothetical protein
MSNMKFANNAATTLNGAISAGATSFSVATSYGALFPTITGDEYFYVRLGTDSSNEVVKVTARSGDNFTCEATASGWADTVPVTLTASAEMLGDLLQKQVKTYTYSSDQTLTEAQCYGSVIYVTGAATITLPARKVGMSVIIITIGDVAVSVDPDAADKIWLDGTALDDGDKITNDSSAGDMAALTDYSADGWHAATNGWTDGGA